MHGSDFLPTYVFGILEGESEDAFRGFSGDEFDALDDAVDDDVLDA